MVKTGFTTQLKLIWRILFEKKMISLSLSDIYFKMSMLSSNAISALSVVLQESNSDVMENAKSIESIKYENIGRLFSQMSHSDHNYFNSCIRMCSVHAAHGLKSVDVYIGELTDFYGLVYRDTNYDLVKQLLELHNFTVEVFTRHGDIICISIIKWEQGNTMIFDTDENEEFDFLEQLYENEEFD